ncbi:MAG: hypothetical protein ABSE77_06165 [Acidimicrobiales bacterium]|jgi:hypothetical protein
MPDETSWGSWQQLPPLGPSGPQPPQGQGPPPPDGPPPAFGAEAPGDGPGPEARAPEVAILPEAHRRAKGRIFLTIAAAVALVGAGTGTSLALSSSSAAGASTPAGAVTDLFTALGNSDVIGMLDAVAPGERDAIEPGLQNIFDQLKRLGVLSTGADLGDLTGLSAQYKGFTTSTDQLAPGVAAVTVTGGSVTGSVDPSQVPLASYFKDLLGAALNGQPQTGTSPSTSPFVVGTEEVGGSWYVSLGYSIAINALKGGGQSGAPPAASEALQATGASTPQGAVQDLFNDVSNLDLEGLLADLPPDEMAALDAYAPDWLPQALSAISSVKGDVSITFGNLSFTTQSLNDGTLVQVGQGMTVNVSAHGVQVNYANGCFTATYQGQTTHECRSQESQTIDKVLQVLPPAVQSIVERISHATPDVGFVTVEENGSWFVSPTRTVLQEISASLALFQPSDIQTFISSASAIKADLEKYFQQEVLPAIGHQRGRPGPIAGTVRAPDQLRVVHQTS